MSLVWDCGAVSKKHVEKGADCPDRPRTKPLRWNPSTQRSVSTLTRAGQRRQRFRLENKWRVRITDVVNAQGTDHLSKNHSSLSSPVTGQKPSSLADEQGWKGDLCCPGTGPCAWRGCGLLLTVIKIRWGFYLCMSHSCVADLRVNVSAGASPWSLLFLILGPSLSCCSEFEGRMISFFGCASVYP